MNAREQSSTTNTIHDDDEFLSSGLSHDRYETLQLSTAFWETVWPKLVECGWEKKIVKNLKNFNSKTIVLATRKDVDVTTSVEGKDYYTRIKDVIELINLRSNDTEATLADRYRRAISKPNYRTRLSPLRRNKLTPKSPQLDLRWKNGRKHFPKKSSMIGVDYQVSFLPAAGSHVRVDRKSTSAYYEMIWDPVRAKEKGMCSGSDNNCISGLPYNLREDALLKIARFDYIIDSLQSRSNLKPLDGTDWNQEQKEKFHAEMFRLRRNLPAVTKSMKIPLHTCQSYYLGTYKSTAEYMLLKKICIDERYRDFGDSQQDVCVICADGGNLLICDGCEGEYHMKCLNPPLGVVPAGHWLCDECVDRKALKARDLLLEKSLFFEKSPPNELTLDESKKFDHRPSEQFFNAVSTFSFKLNEICRKSLE